MKKFGFALIGVFLSQIGWAQPTGTDAGSTLENALQHPSIFDANRLFQATKSTVSLIRIEEDDFKPEAGKITFSEFALNTVNPTYNPSDYGGTSSSPQVQFAGYFQGQYLGDSSTCPPGAALSGCVIGHPNSPLRLDATAPQTQIVNDTSNPTSPVLSGSPIFNGPIAIWFDKDIAGVGLDGGYFNANFSVAITAFDRNGNLLGSVKNSTTGIEFFGLVTSDGKNHIAGVLFSIVGEEPAGFAIDNLRFALSGQVDVPKEKPQISIDGGFIKLDVTGGEAPENTDCTLPESHYGRMVFDEINGILYICSESGWRQVQTN